VLRSLRCAFAPASSVCSRAGTGVAAVPAPRLWTGSVRAFSADSHDDFKPKIKASAAATGAAAAGDVGSYIAKVSGWVGGGGRGARVRACSCAVRAGACVGHVGAWLLARVCLCVRVRACGRVCGALSMGACIVSCERHPA
jgi:hypothetical protein